MKEIMALAFLAVKKKLNPKERKNCFEIFGFDFLVDVHGIPWLIEANTNPCLDEASPILKTLLPRMLDDAFKIVLDPFLPCKS